MLSIKNLVKVYNTKVGESVRALDGVSIDFPETGMVFLLGKSGSGKSTLLNVSGGLDYPTEGEIIVDGRSSKDFSIADFDGYRNSHIGFVFQEFNMLEEFNVEQNIALALQLQQKESNDQAVKEILEIVELSGVEKRKPNTLSGGQKQRVAIARALIKDPQIIMADEPTGALDSLTGKQIFETLKKLSQTRLVVVVTHDRDFAEEYGDRIIELKDGKVLSDVSKTSRILSEEKNVTIISDNVVKVNDWDKITQADIKDIAKIMKRSGATVITGSDNLNQETKMTVEKKSLNDFKKFTATEKIVKEESEKKHVGKKVDFIKARLPIKNALKMAFESLKLKPIRLTFTVVLSIIAFIFFGVAATFMLYDPNYSIATALEEFDYKSVVMEKRYSASYTAKELSEDGKGVEENEYQTDLRAGFSVEEIDNINNNKQGLRFVGLMDIGAYDNELDNIKGYKSNSLLQLRQISVRDEYKNYYSVRGLCGFSDCGEAFMEDSGFSLIEGAYPKNYNEIAVSNYIYNIYKNASDDAKEIGHFDYSTIKSFIGANIMVEGIVLKVTGVYNVGEIPEKFQELYNNKSDLNGDGVSKLKSEMTDFIKYSFHTVGFVSEDFYSHHRYDAVELDMRTLSGTHITDEEPTGYISSNRKTAVFTPKSIWQYDEIIHCYDLNGNKIDFSIDQTKAYYPLPKVLDSLDTYVLKIENSQETKHQEFYDVYLDYKYGKSTVEQDIFLMKGMLEDYENVVGVPFNIPSCIYVKNAVGTQGKLDVAGIYTIADGKMKESNAFLISDETCEKYSLTSKTTYLGSDTTDDRIYVTNRKFDIDSEKYGRIITLTDNEFSQTMFVLRSGDNGDWYAMKNNVYEDVSEIAEGVDMMKGVFYVAGGIFGLFAILMLFNFISATILSKQKEIGILRAIGARKTDVFKIFVIEALMITLTCFVVSAVLSGVACSVLNGYLVTSAVGLTALNYGPLSVFLLLLSTIAVAAIATIIPVTKAANKAPVESIRQV